jgi:hypothetical protein
MTRTGPLIATLLLSLVALTACSNPSPNVTFTNKTNETVRLTGNCVADDAHELAPGATDNDLYLGAQCRIDNGDGLNGTLACVTLKTAHTEITASDLHNPPGPNDCWGSGTRH